MDGKGDLLLVVTFLNQNKPKLITGVCDDAQTIHEYTNDNLPSLAAGNDTTLIKPP